MYRDLNLKHEIQSPLVDKFMVQEKDEKGQTNTIFKMELIQKFLKRLLKKEVMILVDMNQVTISNLMIQVK